MSEELRKFLFSLSIIFPAAIGLLRYRNSDPRFRPFLFYILVSLINELLVGLYLVRLSRTVQTIDWQLFNLFECMILLTQFYVWRRFRKYRILFFISMVAFLVLWIAENFVFGNISSFNPVFLISYSFTLILLSINTINYIVVHHNISLFRNGMFILCVGMVIFFIYYMTVFTVLTAGPGSRTITNKIFGIQVYVNALVNIIYAAGIYFMPRKTESRIFIN